MKNQTRRGSERGARGKPWKGRAGPHAAQGSTHRVSLARVIQAQGISNGEIGLFPTLLPLSPTGPIGCVPLLAGEQINSVGEQPGTGAASLLCV